MESSTLIRPTPPLGFHSGSLAFTTFHLQEVFSHCSTLLPGASEESHLHPCKLGSLSFIGNQLQWLPWVTVWKGWWRTAGSPAGLLAPKSIHSLFDAFWELKHTMLIISAISACDFSASKQVGRWHFLSPLQEKAHSSRKFGSPSPSWKQVCSCLTSLQPWRWNFNCSDWWKRGGKVWFGCRTQSQDLLHSTPCPDSTSSCALGITLCH